MKNTQKKQRNLVLIATMSAALVIVPPGFSWAADIDIYGPTAEGTAPNVMFLLDNTSNWSSNNQNWNAGDAYAKCSVKYPSPCADLIETIYYKDSFGGSVTTKKRPWETGYKANKDNVELTQGQVQLRALKLVLDRLICNPPTGKIPLNVNVGVSMIGTSGSVLSNGHATGYIRFAIQNLRSSGFSPAPTIPYADPSGEPNATSSCQALKNDFNYIDANITSPTFKAPSNANYGAAMYEIFKYFGGHTNPDLAPQPAPNGASPVGATGYGPIRYSNVNTLDDPNAFVVPTDKKTYKSPISAANSCGANYVVLVGNTYPNFEPKDGGPTVFEGINYTPPALNVNTSDTTRKADEWSYFLANTDVSKEDSVQRVFTFAINTYKDKPDSDQRKLLSSMADVGGANGYYEVNGDLAGMVDAFENALVNIAAVNSVFTATTLPVSTTTQGTYLNQIFVGMFRPDANFSPRWLGNLKQYQLGLVNNSLDLLDADNKSALKLAFFDPTARSFWTTDSVFFSESPSGTPASASDNPDGAIVEKGGAAQKLRVANLQNSTGRNVYTLPASPMANDSLSGTPFSSSISAVTAAFTTTEIAWVRGENNLTANTVGSEAFGGSYLVGTTVTPLSTTGARHSIHGDVLHSRPIALNYGNGDVMVYYGSNDGFLHAIDGNKSGTTAGQERWSLVVPEHYSLLKRLRSGTPEIQLPETNSSGATITPPSGSAPKDYGMDGPIGVYARYTSSGASLVESIIFPAMRRGGRTVYALDVSSKTDPKFKWKITGGSGGDYADLGQTWSMPKPLVLPSDLSPVPLILVMGGGYDPKEDQNGVSSPQLGNAVYIINGRTGALIKKIATEYSVPSDVTLVDVNFDGMPDRAYVADVRGNLYRIDFPTYTKANIVDATALNAYFASWTSVTAVKIAKLDGKNVDANDVEDGTKRVGKVFYPPDVVVTSKFVAVLLGTGDREKPLLNSTTDNFFLIKDTVETRNMTTTPSVSIDDLTKVAKIDKATMKAINVNSSVNDPEGCYLQLATNGEKVVNAAFSIAGVAYFGTNRPTPVNKNVCTGDLGDAYSYKFPLFCGVPGDPTPSGAGMLPSPVGGVVLIDVGGVPTKVPFLIGGGTGGSPFKPEIPKPSVAPVRSRLYWRIDNKNR